MRYLLDMNTLVYALNAQPRHQAILARLERESAQDLFVSAITLAELHYGAAKSRRRARNLESVRRVAQALNVAAFDDAAAAAYGELRAELERAGTPIGPLDALIAAHALSLGMIPVTAITREFERVRGLRVENWLA